MMCVVIDAKASDDGSSASRNEEGVLANLPRTRPQRSSPRRAAARAAPSPKGTSARRSAAPPPKKAGTARRSASAPRRAPAPVQDTAPRQGFECEADTASGPVQPPGGVELVASAAEILAELAKGGLSRSERLLKDLVSRLPPS